MSDVPETPGSSAKVEDQRPLVSVITVCRDSEATIGRAIESVLAQTYPLVEYVVVDGASSDGTVDVVKAHEPAFEGRMRWVSEPDGGIYDAMNKGVHLARGEYIAFLNADDWYLDNGIEALVDAITREPASDIAYGGMVSVPVAAPDAEESPWTHAGCMTLDPLMRTMPACHEAMLFLRDLHDRFGDYRTEYRVAADYEFLLRCLEGGATSVRVDVPVVYYSEGGASDADAAAVEREYASVRVRHGADPVAEWLDSRRRILNGRLFRALTSVPVLGSALRSAYGRRRQRER